MDHGQLRMNNGVHFHIIVRTKLIKFQKKRKKKKSLNLKNKNKNIIKKKKFFKKYLKRTIHINECNIHLNYSI
jgi:hypothetical protein